MLLDGEGNAFLTDFGIAKILEMTADLTGSGLIGTPHYMSPEQCLSSDHLTPASDQYALGIMVYEMVTGHLPFEGGTPIVIIRKQIDVPVPPPSGHLPDLPGAAEEAVLRALDKDPANRFASCSDFTQAFDGAIRAAVYAGETTPAIPFEGFDVETSEMEAEPPLETEIVEPPPSAAPPPRQYRRTLSAYRHPPQQRHQLTWKEQCCSRRISRIFR